MILIGVVFGAFTGNMEAVSKAALDSAGEAVSLCITMIGVGRSDGNCAEIGTDRKDDERNIPFYFVSFSEDSAWTSGA